ncbi:hypothetical protein HK100_009267, partial [Physocladia obscura]
MKTLADELQLEPTVSVKIASIVPPNPGVATPALPFSDPKHCISRDDIWNKMDETFASGNICILRGIGGSGKTYAACKYAHQCMKYGQNVAWIKSDSLANAESKYREYVVAVARHPANTGKFTDVHDLPFNQILTEIVQNDIGRKFLLILDNVDDYTDVEHIVSAHSAANCKVLITTRCILTPTNSIAPLDSILVSIPSEEACILFFQSLEYRTISAEDAKKITDACNQLPLRIQVAARYLTKYQEKSVTSYLEAINIQKQKKDVDPQIYPEVSLSIENLKEKHILAHNLLMLFVFLDPDYIYLNFVTDWITW